MRILIIDNEKIVRELLRDMIESTEPDKYSIEEANGVATGLQKIKSFSPDIVFLDIEMDDGTGFDLMQKIQQPAFQLIFTTAHNQYAIQAFKCSAIDYLLKPVDFTELGNALNKAHTKISGNTLSRQMEVLVQQLTSKNTDKQIVLKDSEASYFVKVSDILYCEAEGSYTKFYFASAGWSCAPRRCANGSGACANATSSSASPPPTSRYATSSTTARSTPPSWPTRAATSSCAS